VARPFDLARGPLLRAVVFRLAPRRHRLLLVVHHIVSDGWSMGVLVRELGAHYQAALGAEASGAARVAASSASSASSASPASSSSPPVFRRTPGSSEAQPPPSCSPCR
jgi:NRPS condensation-like uncharacterized protein